MSQTEVPFDSGRGSGVSLLLCAPQDREEEPSFPKTQLGAHVPRREVFAGSTCVVTRVPAGSPGHIICEFYNDFHFLSRYFCPVVLVVLKWKYWPKFLVHHQQK